MRISDEYAAGLFDGEGCVHIFRAPKGTYYLGATIGGTSHDVLFELLEEYGGTISRPYQPSAKCKPSRQWIARGKAAVDFICRIRPWLRIKAKQADNLLSMARHMASDGRYEPIMKSPGRKHGGRKRTRQAVIYDDHYYQVARALNRRGEWVA